MGGLATMQRLSLNYPAMVFRLQRHNSFLSNHSWRFNIVGELRDQEVVCSASDKEQIAGIRGLATLHTQQTWDIEPMSEIGNRGFVPRSGIQVR